MFSRDLFFVCLAAITVVRAHCQEMPAENEASTTLAYLVRRAPSPISVDGKLTEAEWGNAVKVAGFRISGKQELAAEQTVMRLLYDDSALYLGVKCAESLMDRLVTKVLIDDGKVWHDDCVEFFIDTNHDHRSYYQFIVNAAGTRYDAIGFDPTWNGQWRAAAARTDSAWYLEVALPFSSLLQRTPEGGTVWGFNLDRERRAGGGTQLYNWADVKGVFHSPTLFGHLCFIGTDWEETDASILELGRSVEGDEAHLYVDGGYWIVRVNEAPTRWGYRELLDTKQHSVQDTWQRLEALFHAHDGLPGQAAFNAYRRRFSEVMVLATSDGPVDPEACAAGTVFLNSLNGHLEDLYWTARIELLNRSF